jgi:hypothetical protein
MVGAVDRQALDRLGPVWYYTYGFEGESIPGHQRIFLVPSAADPTRLREALREHPGSWWLIGNEPNDPFQDNLSPSAYAAFYGRVSRLARQSDPTCRLVPAGLANADWEWAEAFRQAYRQLYGQWPDVDAWNIHNYILEPDQSQLDMGEFKRRIVAFRQWMTDTGQAHEPLFLTEFGVLYGTTSDPHPPEDPQQIERFVQETVSWLDQTDYVQCWAWFASYTNGQFNGDLYDNDGNLTDFGGWYRDATSGLLGRKPSVRFP